MDRILMITPYLQSQRGNSVTATRLYNGLKRKGYAIDLIAMDEPDWQLQLDRYTQANAYDLVHGFHALHFSRVVNHPVIKKLPIVLTTTGTDINYDLCGPKQKQTLAVLLKASKIVVFNSDLGSRLTTIEPRLQSRQVVIPQGVELPKAPPVTRRQLGLATDDTVFIIPSGLRPVKDLDLALDGLAIAYQKYSQLCLLIVGTAIDLEYTAHIESRLGALRWARYLGEVPHQTIEGLLQTADVVLNTSRSEGQPQGALEAMSLGKPCILTAVPGNLGIIENGLQGYYINSATELAEAALKLIHNPTLCVTMGKAARRLVNDKYSADEELNAYDRLYQALQVQQSPGLDPYRINKSCII